MLHWVYEMAYGSSSLHTDTLCRSSLVFCQSHIPWTCARNWKLMSVAFSKCRKKKEKVGGGRQKNEWMNIEATSFPYQPQSHIQQPHTDTYWASLPLFSSIFPFSPSTCFFLSSQAFQHSFPKDIPLGVFSECSSSVIFIDHNTAGDTGIALGLGEGRRERQRLVDRLVWCASA